MEWPRLWSSTHWNWQTWRKSNHDDVIKWKHFPRYWPVVWGIHRSPVNPPHKGQWRGALMFPLIWAWTNSSVNNREAIQIKYGLPYCVTCPSMGQVTQHNMAMEIYKILNGMDPKYLSALFSKASTPYDLRDDNKLIQPLKRTTTYGIKSLAYYETHFWNTLPHDIKGALTLNNFKALLRKWVGPTCGCSVCEMII